MKDATKLKLQKLIADSITSWYSSQFNKRVPTQTLDEVSIELTESILEALKPTNRISLLIHTQSGSEESFQVGAVDVVESIISGDENIESKLAQLYEEWRESEDGNDSEFVQHLIDNVPGFYSPKNELLSVTIDV